MENRQHDGQLDVRGKCVTVGKRDHSDLLNNSGKENDQKTLSSFF